MRKRISRRMLVTGFALPLIVPLLADANPPPPDGWTVTASDSVTTYTKPGASATVEFRLHPAAAATNAALPDWFTRRAHTPPAGIDIDSFGEAKQTDAAAYTVVEKGTRQSNGSPVVVINMGCQTRGGAYRYGELILPPDMAVVNASAGSAASVMAHACTEAQAVRSAAAPGLPPPPQAPAVAATAAGGGISGKQLEAVLFSWEQVFRVTGLQLEENAYLILKDGTYRTAVPETALEDFDLAADRVKYPKRWGHWRKEGGKYLLAEGSATQFHTPQHQSVKLPARAGEILSGSFSAGSGGTIGTTGYWSTSSVTLTPDGRFTRNSSGGAGGSSNPGGDYNVTVNTVHTDEGAAASVGSSNFGGGGSSRNGSTIANRSGTYKLNGYTMELHYNDGRVVRQMFFTDADRSYIWFAGAQLRKQDK